MIAVMQDVISRRNICSLPPPRLGDDDLHGSLGGEKGNPVSWWDQKNFVTAGIGPVE